MGEVIAAFLGTGKTYFCSKREDIESPKSNLIKVSNEDVGILERVLNEYQDSSS